MSAHDDGGSATRGTGIPVPPLSRRAHWGIAPRRQREAYPGVDRAGTGEEAAVETTAAAIAECTAGAAGRAPVASDD